MRRPPILTALPALLAAAFLLPACSRDEDGAERARAREMVGQFAKTLKTELETAMQERGPEHAIEVCSKRAPEIAAAMSGEDRRIRRIGTRVRNVATNVPTAAERAILQRFAALPEGERAAAFEEVETAAGYAYYAPIFIGNPACLTCHGPAEGIGAEVRAALAARYPDDEAVGYALGDLRGAFVVELTR
jgi:hypothetical protein